MARKKVREHVAKQIIKANFQRLCSRELPINTAQVTASTDLAALLQENPWLASSQLVVKPGACWLRVLLVRSGPASSTLKGKLPPVFCPQMC
jgi:hypothetical protein